MNPYLPIRKVPLDYDGITSSAFSVQSERDTGWKETGVVGSNYMLLPNTEVRDAAEQVASESKIDFIHDKTFFNGKNFVYSMKSNHVAGEVAPGDDVALGIQFWNSYDGSRAFGFAMMLYRLVCTNGMMSKDHFSTYRFKHEPTSENWEENLTEVITNINVLANGTDRLDKFIKNLRELNKLHVTTDVLCDIRYKHLKDVPVSIWGQIVDRFLLKGNSQQSPPSEAYTGWNLLNASTDLLWHKENPTIASYNQNQIVVDGLCAAVA
ncbi:MAG: DUF932 domain-containing protein [Pelagibacterales bacterium]|nr:DUF932 domain-containing protein [Pelagibacterales bacterium]